MCKNGTNGYLLDFFLSKIRVDYRIPVNKEPSVNFCKGSIVWGRNVIGTNHPREGPTVTRVNTVGDFKLGDHPHP